MPAIYPEWEYADDGVLIAYGSLSISAKVPTTLIVFSAVPILAIFQSMQRQNSISSSTSGLPERLD